MTMSVRMHELGFQLFTSEDILTISTVGKNHKHIWDVDYLAVNRDVIPAKGLQWNQAVSIDDKVVQFTRKRLTSRWGQKKLQSVFTRRHEAMLAAILMY